MSKAWSPVRHKSRCRDSPDELGPLAESLGRVAAQVNDLVDKVRLEGARRDAILTGMVEGVLAVDKELRVTFCNAAFATRLRRARSGARGLAGAAPGARSGISGDAARGGRLGRILEAAHAFDRRRRPILRSAGGPAGRRFQ